MELKRFLNRITFILLAIVGWAGWQAWSPRALSHYDGCNEKGMSLKESGEYVERLKKELKAGKIAIIKEEDVNRYLKTVMQVEQSYVVKPWVEVKGVFLNFSEEEYSLCLEREVYGRVQHIEISQSLTSSQASARRLKTSFEYSSGILGKLKLPVKMIYSISPWVSSFNEALNPIISEIKPHVGIIELSDGELILHPPKEL